MLGYSIILIRKSVPSTPAGVRALCALGVRNIGIVFMCEGFCEFSLAANSG